jgi:hypothetical protein
MATAVTRSLSSSTAAKVLFTAPAGPVRRSTGALLTAAAAAALRQQKVCGADAVRLRKRLRACDGDHCHRGLAGNARGVGDREGDGARAGVGRFGGVRVRHGCERRSQRRRRVRASRASAQTTHARSAPCAAGVRKARQAGSHKRKTHPVSCDAATSSVSTPASASYDDTTCGAASGGTASTSSGASSGLVMLTWRAARQRFGRASAFWVRALCAGGAGAAGARSCAWRTHQRGDARPAGVGEQQRGGGEAHGGAALDEGHRAHGADARIGVQRHRRLQAEQRGARERGAQRAGEQRRKRAPSAQPRRHGACRPRDAARIARTALRRANTQLRAVLRGGAGASSSCHKKKTACTHHTSRVRLRSRQRAACASSAARCSPLPRRVLRVHVRPCRGADERRQVAR